MTEKLFGIYQDRGITRLTTTAIQGDDFITKNHLIPNLKYHTHILGCENLKLSIHTVNMTASWEERGYRKSMKKVTKGEARSRLFEALIKKKIGLREIEDFV